MHKKSLKKVTKLDAIFSNMKKNFSNQKNHEKIKKYFLCLCKSESLIQNKIFFYKLAKYNK